MGRMKGAMREAKLAPRWAGTSGHARAQRLGKAKATQRQHNTRSAAQSLAAEPAGGDTLTSGSRREGSGQNLTGARLMEGKDAPAIVNGNRGRQMRPKRGWKGGRTIAAGSRAQITVSRGGREDGEDTGSGVGRRTVARGNREEARRDCAEGPAMQRQWMEDCVTHDGDRGHAGDGAAEADAIAKGQRDGVGESEPNKSGWKNPVRVIPRGDPRGPPLPVRPPRRHQSALSEVRLGARKAVARPPSKHPSPRWSSPNIAPSMAASIPRLELALQVAGGQIRPGGDRISRPSCSLLFHELEMLCHRDPLQPFSPMDPALQSLHCYFALQLEILLRRHQPRPLPSPHHRPDWRFRLLRAGLLPHAPRTARDFAKLQQKKRKQVTKHQASQPASQSKCQSSSTSDDLPTREDDERTCRTCFPLELQQDVDTSVVDERKKKIGEALSSLGSCSARCSMMLQAARRGHVTAGLELRVLEFMESELSFILMHLNKALGSEADPQRQKKNTQLRRAAQCFHSRRRRYPREVASTLWA
ncbi:hypothetical protein HU200_048818 [Digitaria exilis]|uniref:Uncharacterized protein n=1 Tax=Digitaria exilis TaxID=1010633 RepID=A0A835E7B0_9POAL|nr:hypothetical protein HU200_048818 [Digitaria exilis]